VRRETFYGLKAAEFHWFFVEADKALEQGVYLPAICSFLIGIEASLRLTMHQHSNNNDIKFEKLSNREILSNKLLFKASILEIPVGSLAFPEESDFLEKLKESKKEKENVDIVKLRHDLCHGNITNYIRHDPTVGSFFVPDLLREIAGMVRIISLEWCRQLKIYRTEKMSHT
jgi:hypothetical protein